MEQDKNAQGKRGSSRRKRHLLRKILLVFCVLFLILLGVGYITIRPEYEAYKAVAYEKLAGMSRSDFALRSDTEIFDREGERIGLINAGHYEYVPISEISQNIQNAFFTADSILRKLKETNPEEIPIVVFHAATTAEKKTMKFYLDGRAAAVIGTHSKVLTADASVSAKGTAYITDIGRVGSFISAGGFDPETEIRKLRSQLPVRSMECWNDGVIQGVVVDISEETGMATAIVPIMKHISIKRPESREAEPAV